jgi:prepilin-type N-terminal cleavage/methylation domain-containing protein
MKREAGRGFTLSETMLCMLILSVISTYSIPKVCAAQQHIRKKAVLRETISALSEVVYLGGLTGGFSPGVAESAPAYILSKINAVKSCHNSMLEGCFPQGFGPYPTEADNPGFILANGAMVTGVNNGWSPNPDEWEDGIVVDWNGPEAPNMEGDDQLWLHVCYGPKPCSNGARKVGSISAVTDTSQLSLEEIFSR